MASDPKRERLDAFLDRRDLAAVWFAQPASFAWLTGGSNVVSASDPTGVAAVGYDGADTTVVTDTIEAERLRDEELPENTTITRFPWYETDLPSAVADRTPRPAAADVEIPGLERFDPSPLRQPLTDAAIDRYRRLGAEAAAAVETACEAASVGDTERSVAADIVAGLTNRGIRAPVVLVGAGQRAQTYRHFTVGETAIEDFALVSVTAERHGLHASLTRTIAFDPPSWLWDRYRDVAAVETAALCATRAAGQADGTAESVFAAIQSAYESVGRPGEWRNHHQGGAAGYAGREWIGTPGNDATVTVPMAYAWNPTVPGAKSENTWLVTAGDVECLTPGRWGRTDVSAPDGRTTLDHPRPAPGVPPD